MHEASTEHLEFGPAQYYAKSISQCAASPTTGCGISFCAVSSSVFATALFLLNSPFLCYVPNKIPLLIRKHA